jgi:gluconokinase
MIVVLIGVAGSSKTTTGERLAAQLHIPFLDADALHTPENVEQMKRGEPLTDAERDAWLDRVVAAIEGRDPMVLACSALRRVHRDRLRAVSGVRMFLLDAPAPVLERRLRERHGHFFPARLLQSQLDTFERPLPAEGVEVIDADRPPEEIVSEIAATLEES